jgi:hypothetical protein
VTQTKTADPVAAATSIAALLRAEPEMWEKARAAAKGGPRVLIATNVMGFHHVSLLEAMLAISLTLRGAEVEIVQCDAALPACLRVERHNFPDLTQFATEGMTQTVCDNCKAVGQWHFGMLGLKTWQFSELLTAGDRTEISASVKGLSIRQLSTLVSREGDKVGEQGLAGALRYYARGALPDSSEAEEILRKFVAAAMTTSRVYDRLLPQRNYVSAVFHHGIYVPQGPAGDALRRHGVRVINWNPSYRQSTFIFSHGDSYHHTLMEEPTAVWENMEWSPAHEKEITDYLTSRALGTRDWIWFFEKPDQDALAYAKEVGLDPNKPTIGMLSNVAWDAQLHYPANAFKNMFEWVFQIFDYFSTRPDMQLLVRIHPAEIRGTVPSRQLLLDEINARYPKRPSNIFVVPPDRDISTYALMGLCSTALIYGTKMGVELSSIGMPVIVAGEAWIRNKGLTLDATSPAQHLEMLKQLPSLAKLTGDRLQRARRYAYHFFFRRMIPLSFLVPGKKAYDLAVPNLAALEHGASRGLDVVCDGVLSGAPFVYEAERYGLDG